jgi:hypothetical protein
VTECVTPPARGDWYDLGAVVDDVMGRLRLRSVDVDRARIEHLVPVAAEQIDIRLDRAYPLTPVGAVDTEDVDEDEDVTELLDSNVTADILDALRNVTIELYLRRGPVPRDAVTVGEIASAIDAAAPNLEEGHRSRWGFA